jgi:hypothetical protein
MNLKTSLTYTAIGILIILFLAWTEKRDQKLMGYYDNCNWQIVVDAEGNEETQCVDNLHLQE